MIIGIDPGTGGSIAFHENNGDLLDVIDMPVLADGVKGRLSINAPLLASIIFKSQAERAFCELVGPRPTDGSVAAFGFGRSRGVIEGVLAAAGVPVVMIAPPVWKRLAGIAAGKENKDAARSVAIAKWPSKADLFSRKADIDRAEACLIGWAGLRKEGASNA
jgi:crossover junction endodeoxyribonuclease RuvC